MAIHRDPSGALFLGGVSLVDIGRELGTPTYAYDLDAIAAGARELALAFEGARHLVAYALKANTAGPVVIALTEAGCGADVVSGAELLVALGCGIPPDRILYSGVAKTDSELDRAIGCGERGIAAVQLESIEEIARVESRARSAGRRARVSLRANPGLDLEGATHAHIATGHDRAKFGIARGDVARAAELVEQSPHLELVGLAVHVGSQIVETAPYLDAVRVALTLVRDLRDGGRGRALQFIDTGGGFGVDYTGSAPTPPPGTFVRAARQEQRGHRLDDLALFIEPGRSLVAPHGVLVARVIQSKVTPTARWLMIDAGMNDLLRPALYQAKHRIVPVVAKGSGSVEWRVVGPVCESSDDFGAHMLSSDPPTEVAVLDAGAYGYVMASQYNGRPLPVEAFVQGGRLVGATRRSGAETWVTERVRAGR